MPVPPLTEVFVKKKNLPRLPTVFYYSTCINSRRVSRCTTDCGVYCHGGDGDNCDCIWRLDQGSRSGLDHVLVSLFFLFSFDIYIPLWCLDAGVTGFTSVKHNNRPSSSLFNSGYKLLGDWCILSVFSYYISWYYNFISPLFDDDDLLRLFDNPVSWLGIWRWVLVSHMKKIRNGLTWTAGQVWKKRFDESIQDRDRRTWSLWSMSSVKFYFQFSEHCDIEFLEPLIGHVTFFEWLSFEIILVLWRMLVPLNFSEWFIKDTSWNKNS
jgi:hypothetical protein